MKEIAEEYARRIWDEHDLTAIDDLVHKDIILHSLLGDFYGPGAMQKVVKVWITGFPNLKVINIASICEGDTVVLHWNAKGTHTGDFKGKKPTGKSVSYSGVTIYRIQDGKIIEYWAYLDMQHLFDQLS